MANGRSSRRGEASLPTVLVNYKGAHKRRRLALQTLAVGFVLIFSLFYGAAFALFAPYLMAPLALPLVLLALVVVWALPDSPTAPTRAVGALFYAFVVTLVAWPNYLAVALPGLPWLTLIRLTGFPMAAAFLFCLAMSRDVRSYFGQVIRTSRLPFILIAIFVAIQFITIVFSHHIFSSIQRIIVCEVDWTAVFFICVWLYRRPGGIKIWAGLLWGLGLFVSLIGIWEYKLHRLPWVGHIPGFLKIDEESVQRTLAGVSRAYTGVFRIESTFGTPLGLSEYIALTFPFVVHFALKGGRLWVRCAAAATLPLFLFVVILTDSRLGMVGCFLTLVLYPLVIGIEQWRNNPRSLIGPSIVFAYPAAFSTAIVSTFFVGNLRRHIWGTGAQQFSTNSRIEQYNLGLPKILHNPIGYGAGESGYTLGYAPFGMLTIDTYYLAVALEYGVIGFICYYSIIGWCVYSAGATSIFNESDDPDRPFLVPLAISLLNFFIIKSVFSQQDNHPLVFAMMGMVIAACSRIRNSAATPPDREPTGLKAALLAGPG